jgi:hypothetical protein
VTAAMQEPRAAKDSMRKMWVELVLEEVPTADDEVPLYLTLSGAEGLDVAALVAAGVIEVTETGAIAEKSAGLIVAVESSSKAEVAIKTKFPGLEVINAPIQSVMSGLGQTRYPIGDPLRAAKATIINLDFNQSLEVLTRNDQLDLWLIQLLKKVAQVHADPDPTRWFLLLTLNCTINWDQAASLLVAMYLRANALSSSSFATHLRSLVGEGHYNEIQDDDSIDFRNWPSDDQQKLLLAFVPKRIAFETHHHGWVVRTRNAVRYGGEANTAPMASWILEFVPDKRASSVKHQLYTESIELCIRTTQVIDADGNVGVFEHA